MADIDSNLPTKDTSDGTTGAAVPAIAIQIGGTDGTNLRALSVDSTGKVNVNNISGTITLPTLAATSTKQSDGTQKTQVVDGSGNVQPAGDTAARSINTKITDGTDTLLITASGEAQVLVTPLTNSSVVKAQLQDNSGTAITLGQKVMASSVPVVIASDQSTLAVSGTLSTKTPLTASSPTAATVGVASASAVASNSSRKGLVLTNTSANTMSFGLGATAVLNSGITLYPGGVWVMDEFNFTTAAVNAIASAASSNLAIQEFT